MKIDSDLDTTSRTLNTCILLILIFKFLNFKFFSESKYMNNLTQCDFQSD